jgi:hypothetical protein
MIEDFALLVYQERRFFGSARITEPAAQRLVCTRNLSFMRAVIA